MRSSSGASRAPAGARRGRRNRREAGRPGAPRRRAGHRPRSPPPRRRGGPPRDRPGAGELRARDGRVRWPRLMSCVACSSSARCAVRNERAADAAHARDQRIRREAAADPRQVLLRDGERRGASGQPPARGLRRGADLGVGRLGIAEEQGEQLAAAALALALLLALGLRVALDRVRRELVDVGEDRLGEQAELLRIRAPAPRGGARPGARRPARPPGRRTGAHRASAPRGARPGPAPHIRRVRARARPPGRESAPRTGAAPR